MAVQNKYIDPNLAIGEKQNPNLAGGAKALITYQTFAVAAADDDGSIYRIGRIASNALLFDCKIATDGITGGTSYDLGLYGTDLGAVVDANVFMAAQTMASASRTLDGMAAIPVNLMNAPIWQILGLGSDPMIQYDLAITANTVGTAAGNITLRLLTAQY